MDVTKVSSAEELDALHSAGKLVGFFDVPEELYHKGPGVSQSTLKEMGKSPAHYQAKLRTETKPTREMIMGSALHCRLLEQDRFATRYGVLKDYVNFQSKGAQAARDEAAAAGVTLLVEDEMERVQAMYDSLTGSQLIPALFSVPHQRELTMYWWAEGVFCRGRPDVLREDHVMIDFKTCEDASPDQFKWTARRFGYFWQPSFYSLGLQMLTGRAVTDFVFVAVERNYPFSFQSYRVKDEVVQGYMGQVLTALHDVNVCSKSGIWPGYSEDIFDIA